MKIIFEAQLNEEMTTMTQYGRIINTEIPPNIKKPLKVEIDEYHEVIMIEDGFIFDTKRKFIARPQINDTSYVSSDTNGLWLQLLLDGDNKKLVVYNDLGNGTEVSYWYNLK